MQSLGERIILARKAKHMTQEQLASAVGVARNTISSWERNRTKPDMESARQLSEILEYDFMRYSAEEAASSPSTEAEPVPAMETESTPATETESTPATETEPLPAEEAAPPSEAEEQNITDDSAPLPTDFTRQGKRRAWPWIIAGAAVLACLAVGLALHLRSGANAFPAELYRQQPADDPDRACLSFSGSTWDSYIGNNTYLCYDFTLQEENGQPFSVTSLEVRYESTKGSDKVYALNGDDLRQNGLEPDIPARGSLTLDGGFPKGDFRRIGVTVTGTDADGSDNTFYGLIEP